MKEQQRKSHRILPALKVLRGWLCAAFFMLPRLLPAQFEHYLSFTAKDGLPSNNIYQILEDRDGFIWLGTNRGVVRYDGQNFRVFTTRDGLPVNDIWQLEITPDGKVWFICKSRRLGYIWQDKVYSFPLPEGQSRSGFTYAIDSTDISMSSESSSSVGMLVLKNGFWVYTDSLHRDLINRDPEGVLIYLPGRRQILFSEEEVSIYMYRSGTDQPEKQYTLRNLLPAAETDFGLNVPVAIVRIWNKQLLVKTGDRVVSIIDLHNKTIASRRVFDLQTPLIYQPYAEFQLYNDTAFQFSRYNEFIILDKQLNILERKNMPPLCNAAHVLKDRQGNYWMAGHQKGLFVFPAYAKDTRYWFRDRKMIQAQLLNGNLLVCAYDGVFLFDRAAGSFRPLLHTDEIIYNVGYHPLRKYYYILSTRSIWYSSDLQSWKKVVFRFNQRGQIKEGAPGFKDALPDGNGFTALNGNMVMYIDSSFCLDPDFPYLPQGRRISAGRCLLKHRNDVYIGGNGLYIFRDNRVLPVGSGGDTQPGVLSLGTFDNRYMMVGTDGRGLYLFDGRSDLHMVGGTSGFAVMKAIRRENEIWIGTDNGVHRIALDPSPEKSRLAESFYMEDGLLSNNVNNIELSGDSLWVAQDEGLVLLNIHRRNFRSRIKPYLNTQDRFCLNDTSYELRYGELENLELKFGVLALPAQPYIRYEFKLGDNGQWFSSSSATLSMGKPSPGKQRIWFRASDQHGNTGVYTLQLNVLPLWYQTLWAKTFAILLTLALVVALTLLLRRRSERRERAALLREGKQAELELKALRSQMNPHFVFNSLNAIQYFVIKNHSEQSENYLARFSKLVRMFFEFSRYDSLRLEQEIDLLERYLEIEKLRFEDRLNYEIYVDERLDTEELEIPSMILQPIVENAVNHGIFHKKTPGTVWVRFNYVDEYTVHVSVKDNGVGLSVMKTVVREEKGNYRSRSSEVLKERLKILSENKVSKWKVKYSIRDLAADNSGDTGTQVDITFICKPEK